MRFLSMRSYGGEDNCREASFANFLTVDRDVKQVTPVDKQVDFSNKTQSERLTCVTMNNSETKRDWF